MVVVVSVPDAAVRHVTQVFLGEAVLDQLQVGEVVRGDLHQRAQALVLLLQVEPDFGQGVRIQFRGGGSGGGGRGEGVVVHPDLRQEFVEATLERSSAIAC